MWNKHLEKAYFRKDMAYAGKDHAKNNKTFIATAPFLESDGTIPELRGFKTIQAAMDTVDKTWPLNE